MNKDSKSQIDNQFNNNDANKHLNPLFPPNNLFFFFFAFFI